MADQSVQIDELVLRAPGLSAAEARSMGEEVARRVAALLPPHGRVERLGALEMRLTVPFGLTRERLAEEIAAALLEKLK